MADDQYTGMAVEELGRYWKGKRHIDELARRYTGQINKDKVREALSRKKLKIHPAICFSRKIGSGTLELAEEIGKRLEYRVVDRQIIEYIANETELSRQSIATFDERYPGRIRELVGRLFGERAFDLNEYTRHLFLVAFFLARLEKTIFVGRGIHLMLPRDQIFVVRCISSMEHRIQRLKDARKIKALEAKIIIEQADREQREFFSKVHGIQTASSTEFDMILNLEHVHPPETAADAVISLFKARFPEDLKI